MNKYWFKKYGKSGAFPVTWEGWAYFTFVIGLVTQTSNIFGDVLNNTLLLVVATGAIAVAGFYGMRFKTNQNEQFDKEKDKGTYKQLWGGLVGMLPLFAIIWVFTSLNVNTAVTNTPMSEVGAKNSNNTSTQTESNSVNPNQVIPASGEPAYVSQRYGFKIVPPTDWIMDESGENDTVVFFLNKNLDNEDDYSWQGSINVGVFGGNSGFTIDQIISNYKLSAQQWVTNLSIVEERKLKINGYDAVVISGTFTNEGHNFRDYRLFVLKGDNLYNVSGVVLNSAWNKYKKSITDSVLSFSI